jgi:ABC-type ATPase involved in cell division
MKSNIRVNTELFRAINKANIEIDGITLVAGENGCGKSTISKLLYFLYKTVSNYEFLVRQNLMLNLQDVLRLIEIFHQDMIFVNKDKKANDELRRELMEIKRNFYRSEFLDDELLKWNSLIQNIESLNKEYSSENSRPLNSPRSIRINSIIRNILKDNYTEKNTNISFEAIREYVNEQFKEALGKINTRPTSLFIEELSKVFSDSKLPKKFDVFEYDDIIVSLEKSNLSIPYSIQNAIYMDTPMMISVEDSHNKHWEDLNMFLITNEVKFKNNLTSIISNEIIKGDIDIDEGFYSSDDFKFTRTDGAVFNLLDVATGIKSFAILQLLIKSGKLNDKTLLIIDEPESNLHPQWIIEYARMIVLINKHMGVKFFLASHNPDMVSAIRYISEKEGVIENVNFYLAKKVKNKFVYNFEHLGKDIEPIFESFNIAIERVNQYGI